jgi:hypothetical protein
MLQVSPAPFGDAHTPPLQTSEFLHSYPLWQGSPAALIRTQTPLLQFKPGAQLSPTAQVSPASGAGPQTPQSSS